MSITVRRFLNYRWYDVGRFCDTIVRSRRSSYFCLLTHPHHVAFHLYHHLYEPELLLGQKFLDIVDAVNIMSSLSYHHGLKIALMIQSQSFFKGFLVANRGVLFLTVTFMWSFLSICTLFILSFYAQKMKRHPVP